jgi:hypothetical protein
MEGNRTLSINEDTLNLVVSKLKKIQLSSEDKIVSSQINCILDIFEDIINSNRLSLKDLIRKVMQEVKKDDPELHFNLYMLNRKIENEKISEDEAKNIFETYMKIRNFDKLLSNRY